MPKACIEWIDGEAYMKLEKKNRNLVALCGKQLTSCKFLDDLIKTRNEKCLHVVQSMREVEGHQLDGNKRPGKHQVAELDLPRTVPVKVLHLQKMKEIELEVVFEISLFPCVAVKLTSESLEDIVTNIICSGPGTRGLKRPKTDIVKIDFQGMHFNYQRGTVYDRYNDDDGRLRTINTKPNAPHPGQDVNECIHDAAHELYLRLRDKGITIASLSSAEDADLGESTSDVLQGEASED